VERKLVMEISLKEELKQNHEYIAVKYFIDKQTLKYKPEGDWAS